MMSYQVNEIKISYCEKLEIFQSEPLCRSRDVAKLLYDNWDQGTIGLQECFRVLLLNNSNRAKGIYLVSTGGITGTMVDLRILFAVILKSLSTAIILAHNHPSGTLSPSTPDREITERIKNAAKFFDVKLLDHVILVPNGDYFSFSDEGLL